MRRAALLLVLLAACSGSSERSAPTTTSTTERATTTAPPTPEEAYLADLHEVVEFDNPEWGEEAIGAAKEICASITTGSDVAADDAPADTPQTDAALADQFADMTLSIFYESAGDDLQQTAWVLVVGARHFCPEWSPVIEGDAVARGLTVSG